MPVGFTNWKTLEISQQVVLTAIFKGAPTVVAPAVVAGTPTVVVALTDSVKTIGSGAVLVPMPGLTPPSQTPPPPPPPLPPCHPSPCYAEAHTSSPQLLATSEDAVAAGCKVLALDAGFLFASMLSYCRFRPTECFYSKSLSVSVPQYKFQGSAIPVAGSLTATYPTLNASRRSCRHRDLISCRISLSCRDFTAEKRRRGSRRVGLSSATWRSSAGLVASAGESAALHRSR